MKPIRIRSSYGYLLSAKAAKTCLLIVVILLPLAWVLLHARSGAEGLMRTLYTIGAVAPLAGIAVALLSLLAVIIKGRSTRLKIGEQIEIPSSGIRFDTSDLGTLQLYSNRGHSYLALLPRYVTERLTPDVIRNSSHKLGAYVVEFPAGATLKSFELADELRHELPALSVEKIGTI